MPQNIPLEYVGRKKVADIKIRQMKRSLAILNNEGRGTKLNLPIRKKISAGK